MLKTNLSPRRTLKVTLLAGVAGLAMSQGALALEADAFTGQIETLFRSFGVELDLGEASVKGDKVVVSGFSARSLADAGSTATPVATELTFTGVTELPSGGYTVASLTVPDIAYSDAEGSVSLANVAFNNLYIPGGEKPTGADLAQLLGDLSAGPLTVTAAGVNVLTVDSITSTNTYAPEQGSPDITDVRSTFDISGVSIDLSGVTEPEGRAFVEGLGLTSIDAEFSEEMTWSFGNGALDITEATLELAELGTLSMTMGVTGYTLDLMQTITTASEQMASITDPEQRAAAEQSLGMSILAQLSVTGLSIRYDDESLAEKLITMMATQQNIPPEAMREGLKVAAQQGLAQLGLPQLVEVAADPIATFLDDPQSFEISFAPSRAVSFIELVALAQTPAILMQTLGLEITANE